MRKISIATRMKEVKSLLEANDKQMARYLRLSLVAYKAIENGARVLPLPTQKTLEKRLDSLLDICGLERMK